MEPDEMSRGEMIWISIGAAGQVCFTGRMLLQWLISERRGKSVVPIAFWYLSLAGGVMMLAYAIWRRDPVFTVGQLTGVIVYVRNLVLLKSTGQSSSEPCREVTTVYPSHKRAA